MTGAALSRARVPRVPWLGLSLGAATLVGCAVGPDYHPPAPPRTPAYASPAVTTPTAASDAQDGESQRFLEGKDIPGQWWELFKSPALDALMKQAFSDNPNLAAAQAALRKANENLASQRGAFFPSVDGSLQTSRQKASGAAFGSPQAGSFLYTLNSASVNVSYTLDAFGGVRRQSEALAAQVDYQRNLLEASYLALSANIVTAAVSEASLRGQIAATEEIVRSQQTSLDITEKRVRAGAASRADVLQQQATLQNTLATLPGLRSQLAQQRNQLATYVGSLPADYSGATIELDSLELPRELPVSLPSALVAQRPDVQQTAALLHAATAQVGVATANMLPQITLTGSYGGQAIRFGDLFSPASNVWSVAAGLTQPLFHGGALRHARRAAIASAQEAAANYQATVLTAFQNVADSLHALHGDAEVLAAEAAAERAAADSLKLLQSQLKSGGANYLQVLVAEQTYQTTAIALVKARAQRFADSAALFQALGGGWWNRSDVAAN